jgi:hypothetical protein
MARRGGGARSSADTVRREAPMTLLPLLPFMAAGAVVLVALVIAAVVMLSRKMAAERSRIAGIEQWARENDWYVDHRPEVGWSDRVPGGDRRGASLEVRGFVHGYPVAVAEYSYTTTTITTTSNTTPNAPGGMTISTTTHQYVVTLVRLAAAHPPVAVLGRGPVSRLGRVLFGEGSTAVGNPEFDRLFRVRSGHPDHARTVVGRALVGEHLAGTVPVWDLAGHELITWEPGRIADPRSIPARSGALVRVAMLLGR